MGSWFKRNFLFTFFGIFALVGTGLGIGAATAWLNGVQLSNEGVQATGTVVEMVRNGNTQAPVVEFRLENGQLHTYTSAMFSSPPAYSVGETFQLWYNPDNPDEVFMPGMDSWFVPAILGFFFLVFGGIGYGGIIYQLLKKRDIAWLKTNGQVIEAKFTGAYLNTSVKMNGASPYAIHGQWLDKSSNKMYVFQSEDIWYDPTEHVNDQQLKVLIDPKNPGLYYMDISFLPEQGN